METSVATVEQQMMWNNFISSISSFTASPTLQQDPRQCRAEALNGDAMGEVNGFFSPSCIWADFLGMTWTEFNDERHYLLEGCPPPVTPPVSLSTSSTNAAELLEIISLSMAQQDQNSEMRWQEGLDISDSFEQLVDETRTFMDVQNILELDLVLEPSSTNLQLGSQNQESHGHEKCVQVDTIAGMHSPSSISLEDDALEDAMEEPESPISIPVSDSLVHPEDLLYYEQPVSLPHPICELRQPSASESKAENVVWETNPPQTRTSLRCQRISAKVVAPPKQKPVDYSKSPPIEQIMKLLGYAGRWRKYGRKMMRNCPYPAHYYKCTVRGCGAKRKVWYDQKGELKVFGKGEDHVHRPLSNKAACQKGDDQALYDSDSSPTTSQRKRDKKSASRQSISATAESTSWKRKHTKSCIRPVKPKQHVWPRQPNPSWRFRDASIKMENAPADSKHTYTDLDEGKVLSCMGQEASNGVLLFRPVENQRGVPTTNATSMQEEGGDSFSNGNMRTWPKLLRGPTDMTLLGDSLPKALPNGGIDAEYLISAPNMLRQHSWRRLGRF